MNFVQIYSVAFAFICMILSGAVIMVYGCLIKKKFYPQNNEMTSAGISNLFLVSFFTSWISPFTVLTNQPANKSIYFLLISFTTLLYYVCTWFITFKTELFGTLPTEYLFCLLIPTTLSLIIMHFLGNYHFMYKVSKYFCCWYPIVHRSMISDYLVNPELLGLEAEIESEVDFPDFFKAFLNDTRKNDPFHYSGDTVLHLAFRNKRFR